LREGSKGSATADCATGVVVGAAQPIFAVSGASVGSSVRGPQELNPMPSTAPLWRRGCLRPFTLSAVGPLDVAARRLCYDLMLFNWPLYDDFRRLAARFATVAASPVVQMRLEHVIDDSCRKFHVDAVGLRLLCTYAGPGTEWIDAGGKIRHMAAMEVAIFKGSAYARAGPRVLHRSPPLSTGRFVGATPAWCFASMR
jgi:hypothetical protein